MAERGGREVTTHEFRVMGEPEAKGNMKGFPRGRHVIITDGNKNLKAWEQAVRYEAQRYTELNQLQCASRKSFAVTLYLAFFFRKPVSMAKSIVLHNKRPDLDKLVRAIGDALTGIVYDDDSQIDVLTVEKGFAEEGDATGVRIRFSFHLIRETR
jgi:crossover junction endodeoxyribonuclease RusA